MPASFRERARRMGDDFSYSDYLDLPVLLSAQHPLTNEHDELLFVIIHQTSELWIKLCLHELGAVIRHVHDDVLAPASKMLARIGNIQTHLTQSWETLSTMTPSDYHKFREALGISSGLQSYQYRLLEFQLGGKNAEMVDLHRDSPDIVAQLDAALHAPSLYDETLRLLARRGFDIPAELLQRDWSLPHVAHPAVEAAWLRVYRDVETYWDLYELAEKLVDVEYHFQQWRFSHMKTVERIIGFRRGTGGTAGVGYLVQALGRGFFPELLSLRTSM